MDWYQPVHEPGQIFSYPGSYDQLSQRYPDILPLNGTSPTAFFTDQSRQTEYAYWSEGSGSSVTTESVTNHSFESDNSVTIGPSKLEDLEGSGAKVTQTFDLNNSKAVSTQNVTQTSLQSSTGVGIVKPGSFLQPDLYQYLVEPFLFGQNLPEGTVQAIPLTATVQTTGPLRVAFAVDPLDEAAGSWWAASPYKQYVDIALNHPQRYVRSSLLSSVLPITTHVVFLRTKLIEFAGPILPIPTGQP